MVSSSLTSDFSILPVAKVHFSHQFGLEISEIQSEIVYLSGCNSPHITRYLGSFVGRKWTLWIIMEYLAGGSGSDIVSRLHPKATSGLSLPC